MQTMTPPGVLISLDILKWVIVALLLTGLACSVWAARIVAYANPAGPQAVDRPFLFSVLISLAVLSCFYGATVFEWLFVR